MRKIILASSSPRRIELLKDAGFDPIVIPADIDETVAPSLSPQETVKYLSYQKASVVKSNLLSKEYDDLPIVAADTIVYLEGDKNINSGGNDSGIIGKPKDKADALSILMKLSGKRHSVYTGVSIIYTKSDESANFVEETSVYFKSYTEKDLEDYLNTEEPYDKAGAYGIQGYFARFIGHIEGDYTNVMGLPISHVLSVLQEI